MSLEFVMLFVPALAIVSLAVWFVSRDFKRIQRAWLRRCVWGFALTTGLVSLPLLAQVLPGVDRGTWLCPVCGELLDQERYCGLVLTSAPASADSPSVEPGRKYAEWFARDVKLAHQHCWIAVGCHWSGAMVRCSDTVRESLFHVSLPLVPDAEFARTLVQHFVGASPELCRRLMSDFNDGWQSGPFRALAHGEHPPQEAFVAWLDEHPQWRENAR